MPRAPRAGIVVGLFGVLGLLALREGFAFADPPQEGGILSLQWVAPAECPTRDDVVQDVARLLGPTPANAEPLVARARLSRSADGRWHGHIETMGPAGGTRALDAPSCPALAKATALVLALRINPKILSRPPADTPAPAIEPSAPLPPPPPPPAPPPAVAPRTPAQHATRGARNSATSWSVAALVVGTVKELPSADAGGELALAYSPPGLGGRLRLELHGEAGLSHQTNTQVVVAGGMSQDVPGSARAGGGGLRGCYGPSLGAFALLGCAGAELDWMQVQGKGSASSTQDASWATLEVGAQVRWTLASRFALRIDLSGLIPIGPPEFVVRSSDDAIVGVVTQPGHLWGRLGIGGEVFLF